MAGLAMRRRMLAEPPVETLLAEPSVESLECWGHCLSMPWLFQPIRGLDQHSMFDPAKFCDDPR